MIIIYVIIRILVFPLVLGMALVRCNFSAFYLAVLFLRHGGEWTSYRKDDKAKIHDIYEKLLEKEKVKENGKV